MPIKKTFTDTRFEGHELSTAPHTFSYAYMKKAVNLIETMKDRHSKILPVRMDLRYPQGHKTDGGNQTFSSTMQAACREFSRKGYDPQYIAKREQVRSSNPHYHVAFVVNGNKKKDREDLRRTVEKHWADKLHIPLSEVQAKKLVFPCNQAPDGTYRNNGCMIDRNKPDAKQKTEDTIRQFSYLAKVNANDITPSSTKKFFSSQFYKDYSRSMANQEYWKKTSIKFRDNKTIHQYPMRIK